MKPAEWLLIVTLLGLIVAFVAIEFLPPASEPPPYITVPALAPQQTEVTEAEYRARVRGQIERDGVVAICHQHLRTLALVAKAYTVNHARQNLVYVEECAQAGASDSGGTLQAGP